MSIDIQIQNIQNRIGLLACTQETWCGITGVSSATWSRALKGIYTFSGPEIVRLNETISALEKISEIAKPLFLNFKDVPSLRFLLSAFSRGVLYVPIKVEEE